MSGTVCYTMTSAANWTTVQVHVCRWASYCPITDDLTLVTVIWDDNKPPPSNHWTAYISILSVRQVNTLSPRTSTTKGQGSRRSVDKFTECIAGRSTWKTNVAASKFMGSWRTEVKWTGIANCHCSVQLTSVAAMWAGLKERMHFEVGWSSISAENIL